MEELSRDPFKGRKRIKQVFQPKRSLTLTEIQALFRAVKAVKRLQPRNLALGNQPTTSP
ncbi:hypothetical protein GCM10008949_12070 [Deinococcus humi]|nr:hypothetical protein GCM10008949_12070 [Deinococcus humi]